MKYSGALIGQEGVVCGKDLRPRWRYYVKKGVPRGGGFAESIAEG